MTRDEVIDLILGRALREGDTVLGGRILTEMVAFYKSLDLLPQKYWFQLTEWAQTTATIDERRIAVPDDFLLEYDEGTLEIYATVSGVTAWYPIVKDTLDILEARYLGASSGLPKKYAISGGYFILFPTPDQAYPIRMRYYAEADSIAGAYQGSGSTVNTFWLKHAHDLVIAGTAERVFRYILHDGALADLMKQDMGMALQRLENAQVAREEANRDRKMGDGA